ncbi:hypothetical protein BDB01DRAFT_904835 [Pilobolus umbonatus]|nr:hypothetical protein BDB01DRAFT_904835 [Pilobolus umbonatus]
MNSITSEQLSTPIEQRKMAVPRKRLNRTTSSTTVASTATNNGSSPLPKFSFGNAVQAASLAIAAQGTRNQGFSKAAPTFNFEETSNEFSAEHPPTISSSFGSSAPVEQNDVDNIMEDTEQSVPAFTTASTFPTTSGAFSFSVPHTKNPSMQVFGISNITKAPESAMSGSNSLSGEPSQTMGSGFHFTPFNKLFVQAEQNDRMVSNTSQPSQSFQFQAGAKTAFNFVPPSQKINPDVIVPTGSDDEKAQSHNTMNVIPASTGASISSIVSPSSTAESGVSSGTFPAFSFVFPVKPTVTPFSFGKQQDNITPTSLFGNTPPVSTVNATFSTPKISCTCGTPSITLGNSISPAKGKQSTESSHAALTPPPTSFLEQSSATSADNTKTLDDTDKNVTPSEEASSNTNNNNVLTTSEKKDSLEQADEEKEEASPTTTIAAIVSKEKAPDKALATEKEPVTETLSVSVLSEEKGSNEISQLLGDDNKDKPSTTTPFTFGAPLKQKDVNTSTPSLSFEEPSKPSEEGPKGFTFGNPALPPGEKTPPAASTSATTVPSFTFGTPSKPAEDKPSSTPFSFGASPKLTEEEISISISSSSKPLEKASEPTLSFSFGLSSKPVEATTSTPAISFGISEKSNEDKTPTPVFSFRTGFSFTAPTKPVEDKAPISLFSFGVPPKSVEDKSRQPTFSSGAPPKPAVVNKLSSNLSFGAVAQPAGNEPANTVPSFLFGGHPKTTKDKYSSPNLTFGSLSSFSFGPPPKTAGEKTSTPTFSFGAPSKSTEDQSKTTSSFSFGSTLSISEYKAPTPTFSFGVPPKSTEDRDKPSSSFSSGTTTESSENNVLIPTFSFGAPPKSSEDKNKTTGVFSFGTTLNTSENEASAPTSFFGVPLKPSDNKSSESTFILRSSSKVSEANKSTSLTLCALLTPAGEKSTTWSLSSKRQLGDKSANDGSSAIKKKLTLSVLTVSIGTSESAFRELQEHRLKRRHYDNDISIPNKKTSTSWIPEPANVGFSAQALPLTFKEEASEGVSKSDVLTVGDSRSTTTHGKLPLAKLSFERILKHLQ